MKMVSDKILDILMRNEYMSAKAISLECKCSDKTVRTRIKNINMILKGATIISQPRKGYFLQIFNEEEFKKFLSTYNRSLLPIDSKNRILFVAKLLLSSQEYYKIEELADLLYVSSKTMGKEIKEIEHIFNCYDLKLNRKPNYGICVIGSEFNIRMCLSGIIFDSENIIQNSEQFYLVEKIVKEVIEMFDLHISNVGEENVINHVYITLLRIDQGHSILPTQFSFRKMNINIDDEYIISKKICELIQEKTGIAFPECEVEYIAIHLAGKKLFENDKNPNYVVSREVVNLVDKIIEEIHNKFKLDFKNNLDLKLGLCNHFAPMLFRMKWSLKLRNPLLNEIKENYLYPYTIAEYIISIVEETYHTAICDDEIGYVTLHIAMALDQISKTVNKKNILIVCASGLGTSQFLVYKYIEEFGRYIYKIQACGERDLKKIDLDNFDYVFTTIPILDKIDKPIIEVNYFLDQLDVQKINRVLKQGQHNIVYYYSADLFVENLKCETREEVIHSLSQLILINEDVPDNFEESVLYREKITSTEFGNNVAMTHPIEPISNRTFACVAVLSKPIIWKEKSAKVVFLISIGNKKGKNIQDFYKVTSKFLMSKLYMDEFLKRPSFDNLMSLLQNIESELNI